MTVVRRLLVAAAAGWLLIGLLSLAVTGYFEPDRQEEMATPRIFAYRGWQSVGVQIQAEDWVTLAAEGEWLYTPGEWHGPEGHAIYLAPEFYPLPWVAGGALIGRIGESGAPFYVGRGATTWATEAGPLYLRIDDDLLGDNAGWMDVTVAVERRDEYE